MANKMLIDATHPEETRVVVLRGNRVEEFDFESAQRKQLRGNIYLAKVTRVEPSLQAAFVDYGGNRHGFLAFSEIHPDYYQIPVADRQALIDEEERAQRAADDEADRRSRRHRQHRRGRRDDAVQSEVAEAHAEDAHADEANAAEEARHDEHHAADAADAGSAASEAVAAHAEEHDDEHDDHVEDDTGAHDDHANLPDVSEAEEMSADIVAMPGDAALGDMSPPEDVRAVASAIEAAVAPEGETAEGASPPTAENGDTASVVDVHEHDNGEEEVVESVGGADALEEVPDRAPRYRRQYKIQEVIKRRQVMLVQVVKEERGTKGAALTTYLSLAGRYSVLMPNTARGGGISRKITSAEDRARLKEAAAELEVPEGMGVILRTAGASRTKIEIKRDFEYLLRMWETVRDLTLKSTAPKLVYEEGSLVKRSIRDLYSKDIDEIIVAGDDAYHEAKDFMRMLMPSHAKSVKPYHDTQPLLSRFNVESQLDAMFSPTVQLRSGGYIVINQAEALVAIDVNSGRATREHHIEDTALKTNLEAADEVSRQLRLRDLAGLIVIDFIDMDEKRNNRSVERRLKECLKHDRARIQVGRISHFGLLEMSRQRIRTSVLESSTEKCPYCGGSGHVRSVSSLALQVLRALEEQLMRGATHNLIARTRPDVALYVLNQKRAHLRGLEERFAITITISSDPTVTAPQAFVIDRGEQMHSIEAAKALAEKNEALAPVVEEEDDLEDPVVAEDEEAEDTEASSQPVAAEQGEGGGRRRRRRRRRSGRNGELRDEHHHVATSEAGAEFADDTAHGPIEGDDAHVDHQSREAGADESYDEQPAGEFAPREQRDGDEPRQNGERRRRRGRRGGRRNRNRNGEHGGYEQRGPQEHQGHDEGHVADYAAASDEPPSMPAHELIATPTTEPDLKAAVTDLDAAPPSSPPSPAPEAEPPRRRSTVRERAPIGSAGDASPAPTPPPAPAPVPEPVATSGDETAETDKPRRSGWWSRRFAGG